MPLSVLSVPAFTDNYFWLIHRNGDAYVVDPGSAEPVNKALKQHKLNLIGILITHHHADHTGGIGDLLNKYQVPVYGPNNSAIEGISTPLKEGAELKLLDIKVEVLEVPGHTLDHIAYFFHDTTKLLFCGDTLFAGGCGRLFEGDAAQMFNSLNKIAVLPTETKIFCAHEYTLSNLQFALAVEPDNMALQERIKEEKIKRKNSQPTVPSVLTLELQTNPFMRTANSNVQQAASKRYGSLIENEKEVFRIIREWKDEF